MFGIEYILLLFYYFEIVVVEVKYQDWQFILQCSGEFLNVYLDIVVIGYVDYYFVWQSYFDFQCSWQVKVYGVEIIGVNLVLWFIEGVIQGGEYLMLIYIGSDVGIVLGQLLDSFNYCLWFDFIVLVVVVQIMMGMLLFDLLLLVVNVVQWLLCFFLFQQFQYLFQYQLGIVDDWYICWYGF